MFLISKHDNNVPVNVDQFKFIKKSAYLEENGKTTYLIIFGTGTAWAYSHEKQRDEEHDAIMKTLREKNLLISL